MQISKFTDYCLRILIYLASSDEKTMTTKEIAETYQISVHHAVKASKWLTREGYVRATRGKSGGISIAVKPEDINLGTLILGTSGNKAIIDCQSSKGQTCAIHGACGLPSIFEKAKQAYFKELSAHSLSDAMKNKSALFDLLNP